MIESEIIHLASRIADRLCHEGILEWDETGSSFDLYSKQEIVQVLVDVLVAEIRMEEP